MTKENQMLQDAFDDGWESKPSDYEADYKRQSSHLHKWLLSETASKLTGIVATHYTTDTEVHGDGRKNVWSLVNDGKVVGELRYHSENRIKDRYDLEGQEATWSLTVKGEVRTDDQPEYLLQGATDD